MLKYVCCEGSESVCSVHFVVFTLKFATFKHSSSEQLSVGNDVEMGDCKGQVFSTENFFKVNDAI